MRDDDLSQYFNSLKVGDYVYYKDGGEVLKEPITRAAEHYVWIGDIKFQRRTGREECRQEWEPAKIIGPDSGKRTFLRHEEKRSRSQQAQAYVAKGVLDGMDDCRGFFCTCARVIIENAREAGEPDPSDGISIRDLTTDELKEIFHNAIMSDYLSTSSWSHVDFVMDVLSQRIKNGAAHD